MTGNNAGIEYVSDIGIGSAGYYVPPGTYVSTISFGASVAVGGAGDALVLLEASSGGVYALVTATYPESSYAQLSTAGNSGNVADNSANSSTALCRFTIPRDGQDWYVRWFNYGSVVPAPKTDGKSEAKPNADGDISGSSGTGAAQGVYPMAICFDLVQAFGGELDDTPASELSRLSKLESLVKDLTEHKKPITKISEPTPPVKVPSKKGSKVVIAYDSD